MIQGPLAALVFLLLLLFSNGAWSQAQFMPGSSYSPDSIREARQLAITFATPTKPGPGYECIYFGRTYTDTLGSPQAIYGMWNNDAYRTIAYQVNNITGGINLNGTKHLICDIAVPDGASCDTMRYLFQSYVAQGIKFLFAPVQFACTDLALIAEQNGAIYGNGADYTLPLYQYIYNVTGFVDLKWAFTSLADQRVFGRATAQGVTDLNFISNPSGASAYKPRTMMAAYNAEVPFLVQGHVEALQAQNVTLLGNITLLDLASILTSKCEYLNQFIDEWIRLKPDIIVAIAGASNTSIVVDCMHKKLYHPPMLILPTGAAGLDAWHTEGVVSEANYVLSDNFTDPIFGDVVQFAALYKFLNGYELNPYQVQIATTGVVLLDCIKKTQSIDPQTVRNCIGTYNEETIYGQTSFSTGGLYVNRPSICQQLNLNGTSSATWPASWPGQRNVLFPFSIDYPAQWLDTYGKKDHHWSRAKKIGVGIGIAAAVLIVIGLAIALFYVNSNYHTIFLPKKGQGADDWAG